MTTRSCTCRRFRDATAGEGEGSEGGGLAARQSTPSYVKVAAPVVVKRQLAQNTPELTSMVCGGVGRAEAAEAINQLLLFWKLRGFSNVPVGCRVGVAV